MRTNLQDAVFSAAEHADTAEPWRWMATLSALVSAVNLPLGLLGLLVAGISEATTKHKDLAQARMPDQWLQEAANAPDLSKQGLAFLAKRLADKGYVSVSDAMDWLAIEEQVAAEQKAHRERAAVATSPGAMLLLERARRDCADLLEPGILDRAFGAMEAAMKRAPGVLTGLVNLVKR